MQHQQRQQYPTARSSITSNAAATHSVPMLNVGSQGIPGSRQPGANQQAMLAQQQGQLNLLNLILASTVAAAGSADNSGPHSSIAATSTSSSPSSNNLRPGSQPDTSHQQMAHLQHQGRGQPDLQSLVNNIVSVGSGLKARRVPGCRNSNSRHQSIRISHSIPATATAKAELNVTWAVWSTAAYCIA